MYGTVRQQFQSTAAAPSNLGPLAQLQQMNPLLTQQPPPPPPPPTQAVPVQAPTLSQSFLEKLPIGLEHAPPAFNLREQVLGAGGANLQYIRKETGVQITLRGVGSLFAEPNTNTESPEPLHLVIEHQRYENLNSAKQLAKNLIETLHQEFLQFQQATGAAGANVAQVTPTVPPPQLNVPPPNVIASVPPPAVPSTTTPLLQHQQLSLVQQQFIPQNGLQMQQMYIQQQQQQPPPQAPNLSIPPPAPVTTGGQSAAVTTMPTLKQSNQIQLQFHQPPPTMVSTQQTPIILNTQHPSIQYQYIQQTTRDMQGNQQITFQPIIQQTHLPMQPQQQYITVQQGNTAYMVPQSTIIQQQPGTQLSFIHQQMPMAQQTTSQFQMQMPQQTSSQFQMQMPLLNVQQAGNALHHYAAAAQQNASSTTVARGELKTDLLNDALPTPASTSTLLEQDTLADSNSLEDANIVTDSLNDASGELINQQILRQPPPGIPITSVPPPPINMSVPPPVQHILGNTLAPVGNTTMLPQQQILNATTASGQHILANTSTNWTAQKRAPPPPLGQPIAELQQMQSTTTTQTIGQQPQQVAALTFTQQPIVQATGQITQQYVQLQQHQMQQQQQQQHYSIIQTAPINNANAFQQQQPQQLLQFQTVQQHLLQQQQQQQLQIQHHQQQLQQQQLQYQVQQQQQQQLRQQAQPTLDNSNQTETNVRSGQKRRSTSELESSTTGGPPSNQQPRAGMGPQSNLNNSSVVSTSVTTNPTGNSFTLAETDGVIGQDNQSTISNLYTVSQLPQQQPQTQILQHPQQQQQNLKTTHIGLMRYNQDPQRVSYEAGHPPPRGRSSNYHSSTGVQQLSQQSYQQVPQQQRMQFVHTQPPPPLPGTVATYRAVLNGGNVNSNGNNTGYGQRRMPRP